MRKKREKKTAEKKTKYSKPILEVIGKIDTQTGGIVGGAGTKRSNTNDGTGVPATKASAVMPE